MKLYYTPGACSQAPHIALTEAGIAFEPVAVDLKAKTIAGGEDYLAVNPKGAVPALGLDDGEVLTENGAILQYIGDLAPGSGLLPPLGDFRRYRALEWLNYIATELHKGYGPLWNPASAEDVKQSTRSLLGKKFDFVQGKLRDGPYLLGESFTVPDAYLFVVLRWTQVHSIDLQRWPRLAAYVARVSQRPAVQSVIRAEGLPG
jgi:glutathione S-transferase